MLLPYKTCDLGEGILAYAIPTIVRIAYTHAHPLLFFIFESCVILDTRQTCHTCLIKVAQGQFGPAICSQVRGRQAVSVSPEAGAIMGKADGESRFPCSKCLH